MKSLDLYTDKRKFTRTPEPGPKLVTDRRGPLLFVVQKHAARRLHYDFRLELDGVLKSWAVPKGPSLDPREKRMAVETEDHPFDYASFEGVIPAKEYGGGNVIVWDCGVYSPDEGQRYSFDDREEAQARLRAELENGKLSFFLRGEKLKGSFTLVRTSADQQWLLIKHKDRFVGDGSDILARSASVLSGVNVEDVTPSNVAARIEAAQLVPGGTMEPFPKRVAPMLAEAREVPRANPDWIYEPKLDGYRVIAYVHDGAVRLVSRGGLDITKPFPEIVLDLAEQAVGSMILDGEIVGLTADGRPSFNALQNRAQLKSDKEISAAQRETPVAMVCFDLVHFAGTNLRGCTYLERRRYLSQCLLPSPHLQLIHATDDGETLFDAALEHGFEGIVAKRKDSKYQPGRRSPSWSKIKAAHTADFVVGGYTKGKGARSSIGALLLGFWKGGALEYVGHVGSGLTDATIRSLQAQFAKLTTKHMPFAKKPPLHRPTTWLDPKVVVEVSFEDRTPDGMLRAPVFVKVRDDIRADDVRTAPPKRGTKARASKTPANDDGRRCSPTSATTIAVTRPASGVNASLSDAECAAI